MSGDASEVEALRARIAGLQSEVARLRAESPPPAPTKRTGRWRPAVAGALIVLMAVLAPLSVLARWAHDEIADTDRYVESVAPLAQDPAIQTAIIDRVTAEIVTRLRVEDITGEAVDALSSRGLPPLAATSLRALSGPLSDAVVGFVREQVTSLVESAEFETAWVEANREAHAQLVAVLTGEDGTIAQVTDNAVSIDLATLIEAAKQRLVDRGFELAERLPTVNAQFTIFRSDDITRAQSALRVLDALNTWLPILTLLCLAGAVAVGRSRRGTLVAGALALALSMLLLGAGLNLFREVYLNAVPTDQLPSDAAAAVYDILVHFIRLALRSVLVVALAVAVIAWVTGPQGAPAALRRGAGRGIDVVRQGGGRVGLDTGAFGVALHTYATPIRFGVLAGALLLYVLRDHPTGGYAIGLLVAAGAILLVVEVLARPPTAPTPPSA